MKNAYVLLAFGANLRYYPGHEKTSDTFWLSKLPVRRDHTKYAAAGYSRGTRARYVQQ